MMDLFQEPLQPSPFTSAYKTFLQQFWEAQLISYEKGGERWIHWTWKTEIAE